MLENQSKMECYFEIRKEERSKETLCGLILVDLIPFCGDKFTERHKQCVT